MQALDQAVKACREALVLATLQRPHLRDISEVKKLFYQRECIVSSAKMQQKGLENMTAAQVLMTKGEEKVVGSWLWCRTDDAVYNAVKQVHMMAQHNIGSLVVLKPGEAAGRSTIVDVCGTRFYNNTLLWQSHI